jgi:hypothetical protein
MRKKDNPVDQITSTNVETLGCDHSQEVLLNVFLIRILFDEENHSAVCFSQKISVHSLSHLTGCQNETKIT